ncbi:MAG: PAS domain S-box protein [Planctomycetota bacterium]|nr:PAS domain S-box protein [Planctomycetota bacterium]
MTAMIILGLSVVLQIAAVVLALRLIPLTGRRWAWVLISAGMLLIVIRRALHIVQVVRGVDQPSPSEAVEATVNLVLSLLFLVGVHRIGAVFVASFKAREQLRASDERFRLAFENARDAIFWADADTGRLVNCNRAAEALVGRPRAEIIGQPQTFLHPSEEVHHPAKVFRAYLQSGAKGLVELDVIRKDGSRVPVEISGAITEVAGQRIAQGIFLDITERKAAQESLRASEERFRMAFENARDAIFWADADTGVLINCNRAAEALLGRSREEIIGQHHTFIHPPDRLDSYRELFRQHVAMPMGARVEMEVMRKDGARVTVEVAFQVSEIGGRRLIQGIFRDITETQRHHAELEAQYEAIREREAMLEAFFAASPGILNIVDEEFRYVKTDRLTPTYFGLDRESIVGMSVADLAPAFVEEFGPMMRRVIETGQPEVGVETHSPVPGRPGEITYWRASYFPVPLPGGGRGYGVMGTEVTETRRAVQALAASEQEYRRLHDTMTDAFAMVSMDGRIRKFNRAFLDMLGYEAQEICQLTYMDLTPPKWHELDAEIVRTQIFPRGSSAVYTKEYRRKDGRIFPVELRVFLQKDQAGEPEGMWAIVRDITERQAAEAALRKAREDLEVRVAERTAELSQAVVALRESEERFRSFMDNSPGIAWIKDEEGRHVYLSGSYERRFGVAFDDVRGKTDFEVWPGDVARAFRENDLAVLRDGNPRQVVEEARNADGTTSYWLNSKFVIRDSAGRRYVGGSGVDVTERLQAQAHLAESRDRLRSVLASMDDLLFVYDKEGRFIDYYCQADELDRLFVPPEQFLGKHYRDVLPAAVAGLLDGAIEALRQTGKVQQIEYVLEVAGRQVWSNAKVSLWKDAAGEVGGMTAVIRDVTERVRAEQELRDSETRYRALFEQSPVAMWEMDFSRLRPYIAGLRAQGVQDLRQYFKENPEAENALIASTRAVAVNQASVRMHEAASKEELLTPSASYAPEYRRHIVEARLALAEGRRALQAQIKGETLKGRAMEGLAEYCVLPGHEEALDRVLAVVIDVTAIKEAQEKLEEMARLPMENTEVVLRLGNDGMVLFANPPAEALLAGWNSGLGREAPQEWQAWSQEALASGQPIVHELQWAGGVRIFRVVPVVGRGYVNLYSSDITARKRAEEQLRDSEARFRGLFEQSPVAMCELDLSGARQQIEQVRRCGVKDLGAYFRRHGDRAAALLAATRPLAANEAFLQLHRVGSMEQLRHHRRTLPGTEWRGPAIEARVTMAGGATAVTVSSPVLAADGQALHTILHYQVLPGSEETWDRVVLAIIDVTAIHEAQDHLRDSEERYRGLFEQSPVAMWEMDFSPLRPYVAGLRARGVGDLRKHFRDNPGEVNDLLAAGRVLAINQATVRMEGVATKEEVLEHTGPDAPETRSHMVESRIALAEGQTAVQIHQRGYTASGRVMEGILYYLVLPGHEEALDRVMVAITDVTAIKEAQEKIEEMARFPMENPDPVLRLAEDRTVLFANPVGERLLAAWNIGIGGQGPEEWGKWIAQALASGRPATFESAHGDTVRSFRVMPVASRGYVNIYGSDITARKRMEEQLRASEAMYRALVETTDTGYLILDSQGRVVDANAEYVRLTGYSRLEEIMGRTVVEWTAPYDRERNAAEVARCIRQGFVRDLRMDYVDGQGKVTPIEIHATVIPAGQDFQVVSLCRDISSRVARQEALRASEARFRGLFEQSPVALWEMDFSGTRRQIDALRAAGVKDLRRHFREHPEAVEPVLAGGKILAVNEATLHLHGVSSLEEMLSRKLGPLAEDTHAALLEARILLAEGHARCRVDSKATTADGRMLDVILNYMILPGNEQTWERAMVAVVDITAVREAQTALQEAHRKLMTAVENERRRLARELHDSVAQDLVALELSLRNTASGLTQQPAQAEAAEAFQTAVGRCHRAVQEIREICHGLYPSTLELFGLVPSLEQLAGHCTDAGLAARFRVAREVGNRRFGADVEIAVFRTAQEAVNNALRHSKARKLALALDVSEDKLVLSVADNGRGFNPDGQPPASLGLASMRERAKAVGGELQIASHTKGTTVTLRVPVGPA